jgi:hypothetical protein
MAASSAVASELMQFADESHFTPDFQRHAQSPRPVRKNSGALHSLEKKKCTGAVAPSSGFPN